MTTRWRAVTFLSAKRPIAFMNMNRSSGETHVFAAKRSALDIRASRPRSPARAHGHRHRPDPGHPGLSGGRAHAGGGGGGRGAGGSRGTGGAHP